MTPPVSPWPIDLAHIRPFRIGSVEVRPATREVIGGERREVLEPRVMQVLVALAGARGEILSRDDLIDACWEGRAVSDDAVNRVLSRLRALARTFEGFEVETITKVGYRLIAPGEFSVPAGRSAIGGGSSRLTRRRFAVGAGAAALVAGAGGLAWRNWNAAPVPPQAEILLQKAFTIMQDGQPEEQGQALAYLQEVTRIAPNNARAWGTLAFNYALRKYQVLKNLRAGEELRCRSAARTALDLDRNEPLATCALVLLIPPYRNWRRVEGAGRDLNRRLSSLPVANHILSDLLADVGRWRDAVAVQSTIDRTRFLIPLSEQSIIRALWSAGQIQRAETLLDAASKRWPQHHAIWDIRIDLLTYTGRTDEAVRLLENSANHPPGFRGELRDAALVTARALAGATDRATAVRANLGLLQSGHSEVLTYLNRKITLAQRVAQRCAALGDKDSAFAILDGYYFGTGLWAAVAPPAGDEDRNTASLFEPPMSNLWTDPRFSSLLERTGLSRYWRQPGTLPDYTRAG